MGKLSGVYFNIKTVFLGIGSPIIKIRLMAYCKAAATTVLSNGVTAVLHKNIEMILSL